jgi:hypothetical protein
MIPQTRGAFLTSLMLRDPDAKLQLWRDSHKLDYVWRVCLDDEGVLLALASTRSPDVPRAFKTADAALAECDALSSEVFAAHGWRPAIAVYM